MGGGGSRSGCAASSPPPEPAMLRLAPTVDAIEAERDMKARRAKPFRRCSPLRGGVEGVFSCRLTHSCLACTARNPYSAAEKRFSVHAIRPKNTTLVCPPDGTRCRTEAYPGAARLWEHGSALFFSSASSLADGAPCRRATPCFTTKSQKLILIQISHLVRAVARGRWLAVPHTGALVRVELLGPAPTQLTQRFFRPPTAPAAPRSACAHLRSGRSTTPVTCFKFGGVTSEC